MKLLGATVIPVESGSRTLKDALNEAMRDWVTNVGDTFYIIGTVAGPHPYPMMVRDFQAVIGKECLEQMPEQAGRQPDYVVACVGGGSNAIGIFIPMWMCRACGWSASRLRATASRPDVMPHRCRPADPACCTAIAPTCCRTRTARSLKPTRSPLASTIRESGRSMPGSGQRSRTIRRHHRRRSARGISRTVPARGNHPSARVFPCAGLRGKTRADPVPDQIILVNLSGRGDKDMHTVAEKSGIQF